MALELEWLGLAEGATNDGRGVLAAVGINQNVVVAPSLPATLGRVVILIVNDDEKNDLPPGSDLTLQMSVIDPDGRSLSTNSTQISVGDRKFDELPVGFNLTAQLQVSVSAYGTYTIECSIESASGVMVRGTKKLYVVPPD